MKRVFQRRSTSALVFSRPSRVLHPPANGSDNTNATRMWSLQAHNTFLRHTLPLPNIRFPCPFLQARKNPIAVIAAEIRGCDTGRIRNGSRPRWLGGKPGFLRRSGDL